MNNHKMQVFLILLKQLKAIQQEGGIKTVVIYRLDQKRWMPVFNVIGQDGEEMACSIRLQSSQRARTWVDLTRLAAWLRSEFAVEHCELVLSGTDIGNST